MWNDVPCPAPSYADRSAVQHPVSVGAVLQIAVPRVASKCGVPNLGEIREILIDASVARCLDSMQNPDNKVAEDMFMKIAKAYEALTDPTVSSKEGVPQHA